MKLRSLRNENRKTTTMTGLDELQKAVLRGEEESLHRTADPESNFDSRDVEIPPAEWASFADSFSRQHEGWLANVSVSHGPEKCIEICNCRLQGITICREGEGHCHPAP